MITLFCTCGKTYTVDETQAGEEIVCRQCFSLLTVPSASSTPGVGSFSALYGAEAEEPPAPASAAPRRSVPWIALGIACGAVGLVLVGFALGRRQTSGTAPAPPPAPTPVVAQSVPAANLAGTAGTPRTGADIEPPAAATGRGTLTLINGTDRDAVVKVAGPGVVGVLRRRLYRCVFIRRHDGVEVKRVAPGTYEVLFCLGRGWDPDNEQFRERLCARFERPLHFEEKQTRTETRWSTFKLTLHRVAGGNARTQQIPEGEFDAVR